MLMEITWNSRTAEVPEGTRVGDALEALEAKAPGVLAAGGAPCVP